MTLRKVASSVAIQYVGRVVGILLSLTSVSILTRYLGVSNYGEYTSALAVASLIVTFSDFGFFWSTIQNIIDQEDKMKAINEIMGMKFLLTLILIIIGAIVVYFGNFSVAVKGSYLILSIFILTSSLNNILTAVYQTEYKMIWPTMFDVFSRVVGLIFIIIGTAKGLSLGWFVLGSSMAAASGFILNWVDLARRYGVILPKIRGVKWSGYYTTVFLIGIMQLFSVIYYRIDVIFLTWLKPSVDVGIYGVSLKIIDVVSMVSALFIASMFPLLVESYANNKDQFFRYISKSFIVLSYVGIPIALIGSFFVNDAINILGGHQYLETSTVSVGGVAYGAPAALVGLFIFSMLSYVGGAFFSGLLAAKEVKRLMWVNIAAVVINVALNLIFIPRFSYMATSVTSVLTQIVVFGANSYYFCRHFRYSPPLNKIGLMILSILPSVVFLLFTRDLSLFVRFPIAVGSYVLFSVFLLPDLKDFYLLIRQKMDSSVVE